MTPFGLFQVSPRRWVVTESDPCGGVRFDLGNAFGNAETGSAVTAPLPYDEARAVLLEKVRVFVASRKY
jgi:hypothetical protein